jgi:hypothetical protein
MIDPAYFPSTPANYFHTTTQALAGGGEWVVDFFTGAAENGSSTIAENVRCVR